MAGRLPRRRVVPALLVPLMIVALFGCKEIEPAETVGYEPMSVKQQDGVAVVTFTDEGADRVGLRTTTAKQQGTQVSVPYDALIYDATGKAWVYTTKGPLSFERVEVVVDRLEGSRAYLRRGLEPGAEVVTVGATEVYGSELGIAGGH